MYDWMVEEQLGTETCEGEYGPRPSRPSQFDGLKETIAARLAVDPQLSALQLLAEARESYLSLDKRRLEAPNRIWS